MERVCHEVAGPSLVFVLYSYPRHLALLLYVRASARLSVQTFRECIFYYTTARNLAKLNRIVWPNA